MAKQKDREHKYEAWGQYQDALYKVYEAAQMWARQVDGAAIHERAALGAQLNRTVRECEQAERAWWASPDELPAPQESPLLVIQCEQCGRLHQKNEGRLCARCLGEMEDEEQEESPEESGELDPDVGPFRSHSYYEPWG